MNISFLQGHATVKFELSNAPEHEGKGALLVRVLKIPKKIECLVPNYQGHLQQPTEGSYLMVQYPGKEPKPYCRVGQDNFRHLFEDFDYEKHGISSYIHCLHMLILCPKDSVRRLSSCATISTLDRRRLQQTDCVQLWRRLFLTVIPPSKTPIHVWSKYDYPNSPAFLYYHLPPGLPATAGEIRIRLTSNSYPSSFHSGTDLITREGIWKLPLVALAGNPDYTGLSDLLLRDGLVTPATLSACKDMCDQLPTLSAIYVNRIILHKITQPFFLNLNYKSFWLFAVSGSKVSRCHVTYRLSDHFLQGK